MAWEHQMAKELNRRNNKETFSWLTGEVLSPIRSVDPETGAVSFSGPLIISCFDGQVMLQGDRLRQLAGQARLYAGQTAALLGNPFSGGSGSQVLLILGVVSNAV